MSILNESLDVKYRYNRALWQNSHTQREDHTCSDTLQHPTEPEGVLKINPIMVHHAWIVAQARTASHDGCRASVEDLGSNHANATADFWGALAEVAVLDALFRAGMMPEGYELIAVTPPEGPDFVLSGIRVHIKCVPPGKTFVCINERQRTSPRHRCDFYLIARFLNPNSLQVCRPIPADVVGTWQLRQGHSAYRSADVNGFPVLNDLADFGTNLFWGQNAEERP